ncbi:MAG: hypothetical protein JXP48_07975 [Acidobacteria bacterium]|nr:hypothetical protein [Acidobacteriota bacterium]
MHRYTLDGEMGAVTQKFSFDGSRCLNVGSDSPGEFSSRSEWEKKKFLTAGIETIVTGHARAEHNVREQLSLSRDRKTLIAPPVGMVKLKQVFAPDRQP